MLPVMKRTIIPRSQPESTPPSPTTQGMPLGELFLRGDCEVRELLTSVNSRGSLYMLCHGSCSAVLGGAR